MRPQNSMNPTLIPALVSKSFLSEQVTIRLANIVVVAALRPGSPAAKAGLEEGDQLLRVNGKKISLLKLDVINGLLQKKNRGPKSGLKSAEKEGLCINPLPYSPCWNKFGYSSMTVPLILRETTDWVWALEVTVMVFRNIPSRLVS